MSESEDRKVSMFFELLQGVYGAAKIAREWPTEKDRQLRNQLWKDKICSYSIDELREAISNAQKQQSLAEKDFMWPNIGLILSGCKRHLNASHRTGEQVGLPPPKRNWKEEGKENIKKLRDQFPDLL